MVVCSSTDETPTFVHDSIDTEIRFGDWSVMCFLNTLGTASLSSVKHSSIWKWPIRETFQAIS